MNTAKKILLLIGAAIIGAAGYLLGGAGGALAGGIAGALLTLAVVHVFTSVFIPSLFVASLVVAVALAVTKLWGVG